MTTSRRLVRDGSVRTLDLDALRIHVYTAPDDGFAVNSLIFELSDRLLVVDGQIYQRLAREVGDVIDGLGKRIDRFIITHNHPDHFSGFEHLTDRYPGVPVAALPAVRAHLIDEGKQVLRDRRALFGDDVASRLVIPDATIIPGEMTIAGVRFVFGEVIDAEADAALTILLPGHGVLAVADLVAGASQHLFTVRPNFDGWQTALHDIRRQVSAYGIKTIIVGHGEPVGPEALPAAIAYIDAAREAYSGAGTAEQWVAGMARLVPERTPDAWVNWSSQMLFGLVAP